MNSKTHSFELLHSRAGWGERERIVTISLNLPLLSVEASYSDAYFPSFLVKAVITTKTNLVSTNLLCKWLPFLEN